MAITDWHQNSSITSGFLSVFIHFAWFDFFRALLYTVHWSFFAELMILAPIRSVDSDKIGF